MERVGVAPPPAALSAELGGVVDDVEAVIAIVGRYVASWRRAGSGDEAVNSAVEQQPELGAESEPEELVSEPQPEPEPKHEPEPEPEPESEPEPEPESHAESNDGPEVEVGSDAETMLPTLSSRFVQPVAEGSDGATPLEHDGPDFRAKLWQSELELRGLQREYAIMAQAAQACQADGETLGRSERNLAAALGSAGRAGRLPVLSRFGRAMTTVINSRSKLLSRTSASFATAANMGRALWDVNTHDGHWMSELQDASHAQETALKQQAAQPAGTTQETQQAQKLLLQTELIRFDYRYALDTAKASLDEASLEAVLSHFSASRAFYQQASDAFEELAPSMMALRAALHSRQSVLAEAISSIPRKRQVFVRTIQSLPVHTRAEKQPAVDSTHAQPAWELQPYVARKQGLLLIRPSAVERGNGEIGRAPSKKRSWRRSDDGWTPCWCVLTGQQFSFDAHWRCIPGRPGGRTPLGDPAAAASRARAKAIAEGLELHPGETVFDLDESDVEKAASTSTRPWCLSLTHRPARLRLLIQCQTEAECNGWYDMLTQFAERAKAVAAEHDALNAEADVQVKPFDGATQLSMRLDTELACPMGGAPLQISRTSSGLRSSAFSLAPAVQVRPSKSPPSSPTAAEKEQLDTASATTPSGTSTASLSWSQKAVQWATGTTAAGGSKSGGVVEGIPPETVASPSGSKAVEVIELDEDVRDLTLEVLSSSVILTEGQIVSLHRNLPFTEQVGAIYRCFEGIVRLSSGARLALRLSTGDFSVFCRVGVAMFALQYARWKLVYSTSLHGSSMGTWWRKLGEIQTGSSTESSTLLVVQDTNLDVFGGFSSSGWRHKPYFYGTGTSFLWRFPPGSAYGEGEAVGNGGRLDKYTWTRMNSNFQMSNGSAVAMGGTSDESEQMVYCYGLWLDASLSFGCTHPCVTYGNEALCAAAQTSQVGRFDVTAIELWALTEV